MTIEPLGAPVLIRPIEQETMARSGIVLPGAAKEKSQQDLIEAVGTEEEMLTDLAAGDKALFAKYTGNQIEVGGTEAQ